MSISFQEELTKLSAECKRHIRAGKIDLYSSGLKEIAKLLVREERFLDALKVMIPAFYIDLSGFGRAPYLDGWLCQMLSAAVINAGIERQELVGLYLELIHADFVPNHTMSVKDSLYLFQLCVDQKTAQAQYVLSQI